MTIHVEDICRAVAEHYNLPLCIITADSCTKRIYSHPRQIAMALSRELTKITFPDLGRRFNKDHTTIYHAVRSVARRIARLNTEGLCAAHDMTVIRAKLEKDGCRCWRARQTTVSAARPEASVSDPARSPQHRPPVEQTTR